jgi:glycosyltransferase involved in cell wall biosynthesis
MRNILVSAISFVNHSKTGSEIYTTFAKRLINDVLTKTPYDVQITTNSYDNFSDVVGVERVFIREDNIETHKTHVAAFNQLLKFTAIKNIDKKYDWVLYLDCDAGFIEPLNVDVLESKMDYWESMGYDMIALRTDATYDHAEKEYLESLERNDGNKKLFDDKFKFYGIQPKWRGSKLPSEHILLVKNNTKLELMSEEFEKFCYKFETQEPNNVITFDMEAFEIGVSAFLAGYNMGEMGWNNQTEILKVGFNHNNWEKIKI